MGGRPRVFRCEAQADVDPSVSQSLQRDQRIGSPGAPRGKVAGGGHDDREDHRHRTVPQASSGLTRKRCSPYVPRERDGGYQSQHEADRNDRQGLTDDEGFNRRRARPERDTHGHFVLATADDVSRTP